MKYIDALAPMMERINEDLEINEKQLLAAREKVTKLENQAAGLKQQLARVQQAAELEEDSCPACYAQSGSARKLQAFEAGERAGTLQCPACHWTYVALPQQQPAVPQQ
jgi:hypothetical protein